MPSPVASSSDAARSTLSSGPAGAASTGSVTKAAGLGMIISSSTAHANTPVPLCRLSHRSKNGYVDGMVHRLFR